MTNKQLYFNFVAKLHNGSIYEMSVAGKTRGHALLRYCQCLGFRPSDLIFCDYWSVIGTSKPIR